jgi:hypothetical protein
VQGPSRTVDHAAFRWTDERWQAPTLAAGVVYELHVGTFTPQGSFDAAIARIPHLVELGVTHVEVMPVEVMPVEVMPVNEFPGEWGWGYEGRSSISRTTSIRRRTRRIPGRSNGRSSTGVRGRAPHSDVLRWYRELIVLRRRLRGDARVEFSEAERWRRWSSPLAKRPPRGSASR